MRHRALWRLMIVSLCGGAALLAGGSLAGTDIGSLAAGYGLLVIGSSVFLGCGLAIQERFGRLAAHARAERPGATIQGHRVF